MGVCWLWQSTSLRILTAIQQHFTLCHTSCDDCFFVCALSKSHDGAHVCGTDHRCPQECDFCAVDAPAGTYSEILGSGQPKQPRWSQEHDTC